MEVYLRLVPGGEDKGAGGERSHLDRLDHLAGINDDLSACHPFRNIRLEPQILCWPWHTPVDQRYPDGGVVAHCQEPLDDIVLGYLLALEEAELKKALITEKNSFWVFGTQTVPRRLTDVICFKNGTQNGTQNKKWGQPNTANPLISLEPARGVEPRAC